MERRDLIKATTVGFVGLSGCIGSVSTYLSQGSTPSYVNIDFKIIDNSNSTTNVPETNEPPRVKLQREQNKVVVVGSLLVGSENCSKAGVEFVNYDEKNRVLELEIGSKSKDNNGNACEQDESADSYKLTASFDNNYPKKVIVTEGHGASKNTTTASL